jgi:hypothetical protein
MLKTVSSITNAIGALNFKGTWDANANSPALASSVGTKGDYYVVGTAGSTNLNGISNWGVGDLATFNGSVWQRVEGGADLNGVNLSVSGTSTLSGLTASTALALNASKEVVSVTNTGTGNNVLATSPSITSPTFATDTTHSYLTASSAVATDANKKLVSVTNTGTGNNVLSAAPTFSGAVVNTGSVQSPSFESPSFFTSTSTGTGVVSGTPIDFAACNIFQNSSFLVTAKYVVGSGNDGVRTSIISKQSSGAGSATVTSMNTDFSATTTNVAIAVTNNGSDTIVRATVTTTSAGGSLTVTCVRIG